MRREIDGHVYDTAQATLIASQESSSTHIHRAKSLYLSADGRYFVVEEREVHGVDGAILTPLSEEMARTWLEEHGRAEVAANVFGDERVTVTLRLDRTLHGRIETAAKLAGMSGADWMMTLLEAALPGEGETSAPPEGGDSGGKSDLA